MPVHQLLSHLRSLRTRLMLWNAGAVAATGLLILLAVRVFVHSMLISDLDEVLAEDLEEIKLHFKNNQAYDWPSVTEELDRKAEGHELHRWFVQFYDGQDRPQWSSLKTPELPPLSKDQKREKKIRYRRLSPLVYAPRAADQGRRFRLRRLLSAIYRA